MRKSKKIIALNFKSPGEAAEFLERVRPFIGSGAAEVKGCFLKLALVGEPEELRESYARVMEIVRQWKLSRRLPKQGLFRHSLGLLLLSTKMAVGIPLTAIADALALKGYQARLEKGYIITNADYSEVCKIAETLSEKYLEALSLRATPLLKRLAAILAAATGAEVKEALERLKVLGLAHEDASAKCCTLATGYNEALQRVKAFLSAPQEDSHEQKTGNHHRDERGEQVKSENKR